MAPVGMSDPNVFLEVDITLHCIGGEEAHHHSAVLLAKKQLLHNGIQIHRGNEDRCRTLSMLLLALASMSLVSIMQSVMGRIDKSGKGVYLQASTLGSLEPILLERVLLRS
ncbi:hypothetical protein V6N13_122116 [Hibiscus sabdariffa]